MSKSKLYMIVSVCILCISVLGSTLAYYRKTLFNTTSNTITYGLDYYIEYESGGVIEGIELSASESYEGGASADVELWKNDNTYDIFGHIYLDVNSIGTNLSNSSSLKYTLVNDDQVLATGSLKGSQNNDSILVKANIPLEVTEQIYTVYIWIDSNSNPDVSMESEVLSLTVRCEATMKMIDAPVNLLSHITNLYKDNYTTALEDEYRGFKGYYAPSVRLMNDRFDSTGVEVSSESAINGTAGNIRYYGSESDDLKNYIYFNCSDYSAQSSSTCETWRIVGIVDGKVKIVSPSIGSYVYDQNSRNWATASLKSMLNEGGSYYTALESKNSDTIGLISESTWYINEVSDSDISIRDFYSKERDGENIWSGDIALLYPSDYGFAGDLNSCDYSLMSYECASNWMYKMITEDGTYGSWLLSLMTEVEGFAVAYSSGNVDYSSIDNEYYVSPVLYLNPELSIDLDGDGSSGNPYKLIVN